MVWGKILGERYKLVQYSAPSAHSRACACAHSISAHTAPHSNASASALWCSRTWGTPAWYCLCPIGTSANDATGVSVLTAGAVGLGGRYLSVLLITVGVCGYNLFQDSKKGVEQVTLTRTRTCAHSLSRTCVCTHAGVCNMAHSVVQGRSRSDRHSWCRYSWCRRGSLLALCSDEAAARGDLTRVRQPHVRRLYECEAGRDQQEVRCSAPRCRPPSCARVINDARLGESSACAFVSTSMTGSRGRVRFAGTD